MKNMFINCFRAILAFFQAHTAVAVVTVATVVVTAVAVPVGITVAKKHLSSSDPQNVVLNEVVVSATPSNTISPNENELIEEDIDIPPSKPDETVPDSSPEPTPNVAVNITEEPVPTATSGPTVKPTQAPTTPKPTAKQTPKPTTKPTDKPMTEPTAQPTAKPTQKPSGNGSSKPTVVQMADPDTGISWDGKSAIVYTYLDGSTGTTPKPGATYEQVPGIKCTIPQSNASSEYDGICSKCGKKEGDGTNGTCVQWLMKDVDCPSCGAHVQVRTCHTCGH